ncbi:hypothetical protein ACFWVC_37835 [Streptomyces sp. NPDC058691]|uniref:hypothetical protein n=1 Tax=Streptomyces sp. NPDC058691 TaxID=3346601 RepID=UPI00365F230A
MVHLIRASFRDAGRQDWDKISRAETDLHRTGCAGRRGPSRRVVPGHSTEMCRSNCRWPDGAVHRAVLRGLRIAVGCQPAVAPHGFTPRVPARQVAEREEESTHRLGQPRRCHPRRTHPRCSDRPPYPPAPPRPADRVPRPHRTRNPVSRNLVSKGQ